MGLQTPEDALARLDELLDHPGVRVQEHRVQCRACGSPIVAVAAVGMAAERIQAHLERWCACL